MKTDFDRSPRTCDSCGEEYVPIRRAQRFCAESCRMDFHNDEYREAMRIIHAKRKTGAGIAGAGS